MFNADAVELIWAEAKGIPRVINTLCDLSLVYGFSGSCELIDKSIVEEVLSDRNKMGLKSSDESFTEMGVVTSFGDPKVRER